MIQNERLQLELKRQGYVSGLYSKGDPYEMNWVIEDTYLEQAGYQAEGKLFGQFDLTVNGVKLVSDQWIPVITEENEKITVKYKFSTGEISNEAKASHADETNLFSGTLQQVSENELFVSIIYDMGKEEDTLHWTVRLENSSAQTMEISDFGVWASFAYVMFRDKDVLRNIHNSAAVFPFISTDYTKLNVVRRDNTGGNLGLYQLQGRTLSVGTYCDYLNLFFENASPSLDGMLYHRLILAGGYPDGFSNQDWIYEKKGFILKPGERKVWEYAICENDGQEDFLNKGQEFGHPKLTYTPLNIVNETVRLVAELPSDKGIASAKVCFMVDGACKEIPVLVEEKSDQYEIAFKPYQFGEHKVVLTLMDQTEDFVVVNVMDHLSRVLEERAEYICRELYNGPNGATPFAFEPVSNQGESLGKLNLVLKKNLHGTLDEEQVRKVEESAVRYVRPKWFENGDFRKPRKLYGDFYRCMDFEYISHLFYLLSEFDDSVLVLNAPETYLEWAADVFDVRVNPALHEDERGKEESQMLGVYFLYFNDLMKKLKEHGLYEKYETIQILWEQVIDQVDSEAATYKKAITEHFYDNAGFGPTAGALGESGRKESAAKYGQLLLANIGYSNDFRAQNPDRWWEALTYMIHSLWGGVTAAAAFKVFEALQDPEYLEASYRATAGVLYCYDTHSTATTPLKRGMAASTYAVAGPHLNRPDLSRNRFGQATFWRDGGIFARLFENDSQTPDWDMGEELVAYLDGFGCKTYIIEDEDSIRVINGSYEENEEEYLITSFAPYSEEFYFVSDGRVELLTKEKGRRRISLAKERD